MLLEAFSFSINLGFFSCLFWSSLTFQSIGISEKIKKIPFFIFYGFLFYGIFYSASLFDTKLFELKSLYFHGYTVLLQLIIIILILLFSNISLKVQAAILSAIISPYIFFLFFGVEEFSIWDNNYSSLSLLKTQNPLIGIASLFLLLIKSNKIQIPSLILTLGLLFYYINPMKEFPFNEINYLHYKFIPYEFFFSEKSYLFEENSGIYTEKKENTDDMLYKLTMRPIRKISLPLKQEIQSLVSTFEFPILVKEGDTITLLELTRSYNDTIFKIIFQVNKSEDEIEIIGGKSKYDTATITIDGPIF